MAAPFLDTNILVYAVTDDARRDAAIGLIEAPFQISVQALNEFANVGRRKLGLDWADIQTRLIMIRARAVAIHPLTLEVHSLGLHVAARYRLSTFDSLLVATALLADCAVLYSEDMQNGLVIENRLTIRNPFVPG